MRAYQAVPRLVSGEDAYKPPVKDVVERKECSRADNDEELSSYVKRKAVETRYELAANEEPYRKIWEMCLVYSGYMLVALEHTCGSNGET